LITFYRLLTKENELTYSVPFSANQQKFAISVFRLQQQMKLPFSVLFSVHIFVDVDVNVNIDIEIY
jgi:hypothetical protein